MTVSIGADPEFFRYDRNNYDQPILPCVGVIPGTKEEPTEMGGGYFVHEDNVAIEIGIPPTDNASTFAAHIINAKSLVQEEWLPDGQELYCTASWNFTPQQLDNKQSQTFGCEPDYDAYSGGKVRSVPKGILRGNTRFAGGHVHLGGEFNCPPFVAALFADVFLTLVPLVGNVIPMDSREGERREWYGKPGIFREKPYGIEYRTPSNYWCSTSQTITSMGARSIQLCHFLESTSATDLRNMVKAFDWLQLQRVLSGTGSTGLRMRSERGPALLEEARALGMPV